MEKLALVEAAQVFDLFCPPDPRLALIVAAIFAGGFIRGFAGFGYAMVAIPALATVLGPQMAIPISLLIELPMTLSLVPAAIGNVERRVVAPMLAAVMVTVPLGIWVLVVVNADSMKILVSLVVLAMVVLLALQKQARTIVCDRLSIPAGLVSGLVHGAAGVGGPPALIALLARHSDPVVLRANMIVFLAGLNLISLTLYWSYGLFTSQIVAAGILGAPLCLVAGFLGARAFTMFGEQWLRPVALSFVGLTAAGSLTVSL